MTMIRLHTAYKLAYMTSMNNFSSLPFVFSGGQYCQVTPV